MCCEKIRSDIREFLKDGFIPPPYPIIQTQEGLAIPLPSENKNTNFANLFTRLAFKDSPIMYSISKKQIPYDLYCPSVSSDIDRRVCLQCGTYFASITAADKHSESVHGCQEQSKVKRKAY